MVGIMRNGIENKISSIVTPLYISMGWSHSNTANQVLFTICQKAHGRTGKGAIK